MRHPRVSAFLMIALSLLAVPAGAQSFSSTTDMDIPAGTGNSTPATTTITVPGTVTGVIQKVTVRLDAVKQNSFQELDILLTGPDGTSILLVSDVGGANGVNNRDITLDDAGANFPASIPDTNGTYKPTDAANDACSNAGAGDGGFVPTVTTLAGFNCKTAVGNWVLSVFDDGSICAAAGGAQKISGWTLTLTMGTAPVAVADSGYSTNTGVTLNQPAAGGLLANDTGTGISVSTTSTQTNAAGSFTAAADGSFTYVPAVAFTGTATYSYSIVNGAGCTSGPVNVSITVTAAGNTPPVAVNDSYSTNEDTPLNVPDGGTDLLFNDTDVDGNTLTVNSPGTFASTQGGSVTTNANGSFSYTPPSNFFGTDTFTYSAHDGTTTSVTPATVTITVNSVNDNPTISDIADTSTNEDTATGAIAFTVGDVETAPASLTPTGSSSNTTLVPNGNIVFGGSGANRTVTITPASNQSGTATITVTVTDADGGTASDTFVLTVNPINDPPTAADDTDTTNEDVAVTVNVLANDTDPDPGDTLTPAIVGTTNGTAVVNGDKTITFTPTANFFGTGTVTYNVTDGTATSANATVTITVNSVNDNPTITDITDQTIDEDTNTGALAFTVGDVETAAASLTLGGTSSNTTLVPNANIVFGGSGASRTVTVTPAANQSGTATITITVTDADTGTATDTFLLTVNNVNDTPTISDIADQTTNEDTAIGPINFTIADVDTGDTLTVTASSSNTTLVPNASITLGGSGGARTISITPALNESGTSTITVTVTDAANASASDTFVLTVNAVNDNPTITDVADQTINEDGNTGALPFTIGDVETAAGSLTVTGASSNTTLVPDANVVIGGSGASRTVTVTPAANQFGTTTITLTVTDGNGATATDTFLVTVNSVNDLPTITDIADQTINEDTSTGALAFTVGDVETAAGSLTPSGSSSNTTLVPNANIVFGGTGSSRTVTVTPAANQFGTATITVTITDADGGTATDTFLLTVNNVNDTPTITDIADQTINEDSDTGALSFTIGDLDPSDTLTVTGSSSNLALVPNANIVFGGSGANRTVTVTPVANGNGTATITVTVTDNNTASSSDTFLLTVTAVNDLPTISDIADQVVDEDTPTAALSFTIGDVETAAASLTVSGSSSNTTLVPNGNIVFGGSGSSRTVTVTPALNQSGTATITITVNDGTGGTASDTFLITVNAVNDAPVGANDAYGAVEDTTLTVTAPGVLSNDSDVDTAPGSLTAAIVTNPTKGSISLASNGSFTYIPNANANGTDSFTYRVSDGSLTSNVTTVTITIAAANDAPQPQQDTYSTPQGVTLNVPAPGVLANDSDVDGDLLTAAALTNPSNGTLIFNTNGSFSYVPNSGFFGADSFTYRVCDPSAACLTGTVIINVTSATLSGTVSGSTGLCAGDSTTIRIDLTGTAPWNITWSDGVSQTVSSSPATRTVSPTETTTYTVTALSDANGSGTATGSAVVTVSPKPAVPVVTGPATVFSGLDFVLSSNASGQALQWLRNGVAVPGATSATLAIANASSANSGVYSIQVTNGSCVVTSDSINVAVKNGSVVPVIGIAEGAFGSKFKTLLQIHNGTDQPMTGALIFTPAGEVRAEASITFNLAPRETSLISDFTTLIPDSGIGSLDIVTDGDLVPLVVARIFNESADGATSGLTETNVVPEQALHEGDQAILIAPSDPAVARMNVGVRTLAAGARVRVTVTTAEGVTRTSFERAWMPATFFQQNALAFLGLDSLGASDTIDIDILSGDAIIYGSLTDNKTNDPAIQMASKVADAAAGEVRQIIPVVGSAEGAFGSRFKTAFQLHNAGTTEMSGRLVFHPTSTSGSQADPTLPFTVGAGKTATFGDLIATMGQVGIGSLDLYTSSQKRPVVVTRIFNDGGDLGQTGTTEDTFGNDDALNAGQSGVLIAPPDTAKLRFNIGVRTLDAGATITFTVRNAAGVVTTTVTKTYAPNYFEQAPASGVLGVTFTANESVTVTVDSGSAVVYGTATDNKTQDPSIQFARVQAN